MVQIGVTAMRAPDGSFLPSVPLYIRDEDANQINEFTGNKMSEDLYIKDIAKTLGDKFGQYCNGVKKAGMKI